MNNEKELKQKLFELISKKNEDESITISEDVDYGQLLNLAEKISGYDKDNVRFSVDAKLVERLGEQLVAKKTTALSELIKNAYDADAESVDVCFYKTEEFGGNIVIQDTGNGMSFDELVNGFMKISTSDKTINPISPRFSRPRAGKKGIGRFSAQKLGSILKIITKRECDDLYLCVDINWDSYSANSSLTSVSNKVYYSSENYSFKSGTRLEIKGIREVWSEFSIETTFNYLSNIIDITPDSKSKKDPGFKVNFKYQRIQDEKEIEVELDDNSIYFSSADVHVHAEMTKNKTFKITLTGVADKQLSDVLEYEELYSEQLYYANYKADWHYFSLAKGIKTIKYMQNFLRVNGGIRLYRNEFNVAPYGERKNDWLGLDESSRRRIILPPHANTNFVGSVYITDKEGTSFEETSAREGVIETDEFRELAELTRNLAIKVASHVASERGKKITSSQKDYSKVKLKPLAEQVQDKVVSLKEEIIKAVEQKEEPVAKNTIIGTAPLQGKEPESSVMIDKIEDLHISIQEFIDEQMMYRVLASSGLAISEFTHEIQLYLTNLRLSSSSLKRLGDEDTEITKLANDLEDNLGMLMAYTDFFDGTMRSNSNREKNYYEIRELIDRFFNAMKPTIERRGYELDIKYDSWDIWTKQIHVSEVMSVFINLFTNACKAIERAGRENGRILIDVSTTDTFMTIRFEDNGTGIPKDKWSKIFSPLYTTEVPAISYDSDNKYNKGMGLGLSITEQIVDGLNGEILVDNPSDTYNACIKIVIPRASDEEIPEDVY